MSTSIINLTELITDGCEDNSESNNRCAAGSIC